MPLPAGIAAEAAQVQQNAQMSFIKQAAQNERAIADVLEQTLTVTGSSRGSNVNTTA